MLNIINYYKLKDKEVAGQNGEMYKVSEVFRTDNFYTFQMYSTTHSGFSQTIRLCRYSDDLDTFNKEPVYKFMDCPSVRVTAEWIKNMNNLIYSLESVIQYKTYNP